MYTNTIFQETHIKKYTYPLLLWNMSKGVTLYPNKEKHIKKSTLKDKHVPPLDC